MPANSQKVGIGGSGTSAAAGQAVSLLPETIFEHTLYLPIIFRRYPWTSYFGVEAQYSLSNSSTRLRAEELEIGWVRLGGRVDWKDLQPVEGGPILWENLVDFENELRQLKAAGIAPVVVLHSNPLWAVVTRPDDLSSFSGKSYCGAIATDKFDDFAAFMRQLVQRYSTPEFNVKVWELGNEPDVDPNLLSPDSIFGCWGDWNDDYYGGRHYASMLKVVTPAIKAVDPTARVWVGGLLLDSPDYVDPNHVGVPQRFFEGILAGGGAPYLDAIPYHWYAWYDSCATYPVCDKVDFDASGNKWQAWGGGASGKANFLKQVMAYYSVVKPMILNEAALGCKKEWAEGCNSKAELEDGFLQAQSDFLLRSSLRAIKAGVQQYDWFMLEENDWAFVGLLDYQDQPKPVYYTYQHLITSLDKGVFLGTVDYGSGIEAFVFETGVAQRLHIVWTLVDETRQIQIPVSKLIAIYDRDGTSIPLPEPQDSYYYPTVEFSARYFVLNP